MRCEIEFTIPGTYVEHLDRSQHVTVKRVVRDIRFVERVHLMGGTFDRWQGVARIYGEDRTVETSTAIGACVTPYGWTSYPDEDGPDER